jgi:hypothetical protein
MQPALTLQEWLAANPQLAPCFTDDLKICRGRRQLPEGGADRIIDPASPDLMTIDKPIVLKEEPQSGEECHKTSREVEASRARVRVESRLGAWWSAHPSGDVGGSGILRGQTTDRLLQNCDDFFPCPTPACRRIIPTREHPKSAAALVCAFAHRHPRDGFLGQGAGPWRESDSLANTPRGRLSKFPLPRVCSLFAIRAG